MEGDILMTTAEVGQELKLTPAAIRAAAREGRLTCYMTTKSGQRLFRRSDVEAFQRERRGK